MVVLSFSAVFIADPHFFPFLPLMDLVGTSEFQALPTGGGYWFISGSQPNYFFFSFLPFVLQSLLRELLGHLRLIEVRGSLSR